ncbi:uncharacterized protein DSM5745_02684 [Aspergillus mulundensis]|uniref:Rhodopsin domain-containing protein n=1 Tax=Aspergillus mulundensis TaxID=1810919 RepID=A0A3D8SID8_9EURO|nr:hypothetical protein DSM5745_02684 [Aspergillus mulundensis]RDW86042.1 hypothetical protein DSM5745_02684 [Aspergillus mulundensis]
MPSVIVDAAPFLITHLRRHNLAGSVSTDKAMFAMHANASETPAAPPPPGTEPNYIDPPSRQTTVVIVEAIFMPLMLLAVIIRVYVRTRIINLWGWEDTTCILAACGALAHMGVIMKMLAIGMGRHLWDIPRRIFADPAHTRLISVNITYPWTVCFTKLSILLLYKRLFTVSRVRVAIWTGIAMTVVLYTTFIAIACASLVVCTGTRTSHPGVSTFCRAVHHQLALWHSAVNVLTDFYVLILPIAPLVKLQMSHGRKAAFSFVFASGLVACAASIARLVCIQQNVHSKDTLWDLAEVALYSLAEINIGIIIACVCTFPKFIEQFRGLKMAGKKVGQVVQRFSRGPWESMKSVLPRRTDRTKAGKSAPGQLGEVEAVLYVYS